MVDFDNLKRREIIKALSGVGVSAASLQYLTDDVIAKTHDDEVPILRRVKLKNPEKAYSNSNHVPPETEEKFQRIGWGRWADIQSCYEAQHKIADQIKQLSGTNGMVTAGVGQHDGKRGVSVSLVTTKTRDGEVQTSHSTSRNEVQSQLPREIDATVSYGNKEREFHNIPVWVKEDEITLAHSCGNEAYQMEYRPVPAGCQGAYNEEYCTIGTPAYKFGTGRVLLGAAHCTYDHDQGGDNEQDGEGSTAWQPEYNASNPEVGTVTDVRFHKESEWDYLVDGAVIDLNSYTDATGEMAGTSLTYDEQIMGWIGFDALKTKKQAGEPLYRQGRTSGRCSVAIDKVSSANNYVQTDGENSGGDSGGPVFEKDGDKAYIAGIQHGYANGWTRSYAIEHFVNEFGIDTIP